MAIQWKQVDPYDPNTHQMLAFILTTALWYQEDFTLDIPLRMSERSDAEDEKMMMIGMDEEHQMMYLRLVPFEGEN